MTAKKVLFWLSIVFIILASIGEATALQLLPLAIMIGILIFEIWAKKHFRVLAIVLSIFMFLINIVANSPIDLVYWLIAIVIFSFNFRS